MFLTLIRIKPDEKIIEINRKAPMIEVLLIEVCVVTVLSLKDSELYKNLNFRTVEKKWFEGLFLPLEYGALLSQCLQFLVGLAQFLFEHLVCVLSEHGCR